VGDATLAAVSEAVVSERGVEVAPVVGVDVFACLVATFFL
jgi:hypothetical protein